MFDLDAFRAAFETKDRETWLGFYAPDATWTEMRAHDPPRSPNVMRGREAIGAHLAMVCATPLQLVLSNEVAGDGRAAFTVTITRPDGSQIVENVIVDVEDGLITRQLDVEAWD